MRDVYIVYDWGLKDELAGWEEEVRDGNRGNEFPILRQG